MSVDKLHVPQLSIITTPLEKDDGDNSDNDAATAPLSTPSPAAYSTDGSTQRLEAFEFTPSPQGVDTAFFKSSPSKNKSAALSKVLKEHLVTVDDDEIVVSSASVSLPELDDAAATSHHDHGAVRGTPRNATNGASSPTNNSSPFGFTSPKNSIPPSASIQHKMLYQSVNSIASPIHAEDYMPQLHVGPERTVLFHTESLGIKISRHTDGYVRVLSVIPYKSAAGSEKVREGEIYQGDVVREVSDVNLRMPIDSAVWKLTIGLIKMAPRPLKFVVAREMHAGEENGEHIDKEETATDGFEACESQTGQLTPSSDNTTTSKQTIDPRFGPTRTVHFLEPCLGVKLHHTPEGYVQILSVTPYKSFPNSPMSRTGDIRAGDVVLEVGEVWNVRDRVDQDGWSALVKYIRETRRPLCMVLADGESLESVLPAVILEEEEEDEENQGEEESSSDCENVEPGDGEEGQQHNLHETLEVPDDSIEVLGNVSDAKPADSVSVDQDCNDSGDKHYLEDTQVEQLEACDIKLTQSNILREEKGLESESSENDAKSNQAKESAISEDVQADDHNDILVYKDNQNDENLLLESELGRQSPDVYVLKEQPSLDSLAEELLEINFG